MKTVLLFFLIIGCSASFSQNGFQKQSIQVLPESQLTITGDTNINTFLCNFNTAPILHNKNLRYTVNKAEISFENAKLRLEDQGFDCGNKSINRDFQKLIQSDKYPEIILEIKKIYFETSNHAKAEVIISIAGKHKKYKIPVEIINSPTPRYKGNLQLNINDFELTPPKKIFGLIEVKEDIEINFNLIVENTI